MSDIIEVFNNIFSDWMHEKVAEILRVTKIFLRHLEQHDKNNVFLNQENIVSQKLMRYIVEEIYSCKFNSKVFNDRTPDIFLRFVALEWGDKPKTILSQEAVEYLWRYILFLRTELLKDSQGKSMNLFDEIKKYKSKQLKQLMALKKQQVEEAKNVSNSDVPNIKKYIKRQIKNYKKFIKALRHRLDDIDNSIAKYKGKDFYEPEEKEGLKKIDKDAIIEMGFDPKAILHQMKKSQDMEMDLDKPVNVFSHDNHVHVPTNAVGSMLAQLMIERKNIEEALDDFYDSSVAHTIKEMEIDEDDEPEMEEESSEEEDNESDDDDDEEDRKPRRNEAVSNAEEDIDFEWDRDTLNQLPEDLKQQLLNFEKQVKSRFVTKMQKWAMYSSIEMKLKARIELLKKNISANVKRNDDLLVFGYGGSFEKNFSPRYRTFIVDMNERANPQPNILQDPLVEDIEVGRKYDHIFIGNILTMKINSEQFKKLMHNVIHVTNPGSFVYTNEYVSNDDLEGYGITFIQQFKVEGKIYKKFMTAVKKSKDENRANPHEKLISKLEHGLKNLKDIINSLEDKKFSRVVNSFKKQKEYDNREKKPLWAHVKELKDDIDQNVPDQDYKKNLKSLPQTHWENKYKNEKYRDLLAAITKNFSEQIDKMYSTINIPTQVLDKFRTRMQKNLKIAQTFVSSKSELSNINQYKGMEAYVIESVAYVSITVKDWLEDLETGLGEKEFVLAMRIILPPELHSYLNLEEIDSNRDFEIKFLKVVEAGMAYVDEKHRPYLSNISSIFAKVFTDIKNDSNMVDRLVNRLHFFSNIKRLFADARKRNEEVPMVYDSTARRGRESRPANQPSGLFASDYNKQHEKKKGPVPPEVMAAMLGRPVAARPYFVTPAVNRASENIPQRVNPNKMKMIPFP